MLKALYTEMAAPVLEVSSINKFYFYPVITDYIRSVMRCKLLSRVKGGMEEDVII